MQWEAGLFVWDSKYAGLQELVIKAGADLPAHEPHPFTVEACATIDEGTYASGCHACELEIDPDTGVVEIVRYVCVNDFGVIVSDDKVRGQVIGGSA